MPEYVDVFDGRSAYSLVWNWSYTQSIAGNYTDVTTHFLDVVETSENGSYRGDPDSTWYVNIGGAAGGGNWSYDFRSTDRIALTSGTTRVYHQPDGTLNLHLYAQANGLDPLGVATIDVWLPIPRIPRGPRVRVAGVWRNTVAYVKSGGVWRIALPHVKQGTWKVGGA